MLCSNQPIEKRVQSLFFYVTEYTGNYVYRNGQLQYLSTSEGYAEPNNSNGFDYVYQYVDHLGNIRLSYKDADGNGSISTSEIVEEKNYYPFGLQMKGFNNTLRGRSHNYGYNGKEENDEFGLATLDYGARNYDPTLGRWFVIDALADDVMQVDKSTYAYSWNSPISLNDPDGNCPWCLGAVIGAVSEYAVQVTVNLAKGQSLEDAAFNNVDFADVGLAAVEGAVTLGASAVRRIGVRVATEVVKAAIDVNGSGDTDVIGTEGSNKTVTGLVVDTAIGVIGAEGGDKLAKGVVNASSDAAVKTAKSNVKAASKNLDKANNIVFNGGKKAAQGSKAKSVSESFTSFTAAKEAQATTQALNNTVGQLSEDTVKTIVGTAEGTASTVAAEKTIETIEKQK
ncbi:hypothetical protein AWE51_19590 [Aquimarina aggregata]|uniref:EF-hand domain-containing protein n=1 Tax=Aquimarina aggregata TaxID=1642818 RepID=A0A162WQE8_9FLAO|nr:RHS repeat-associated core domain-containing protein [Aquimarina aggregata]KZS38241.1 hypothetical protein AWE51_19590 [Aquimarina aggregata]